jgi:signal transduction histidine kinase
VSKAIDQSAAAIEAGRRLDGGGLAALAAALLIVTLSAGLLLYRLAQPDDGYRLWLDGANNPGEPAGLLVAGGAQSILAVEAQYAGEIVAGALALRPDPPAAWRLGATPTYRFTGPYGPYEAQVWLRRTGRPALTNGLGLIALAYLPIAALAFARRPQLPAARILLLYAAAGLAGEISRAATGGWSELRLADLFAPGAFWPTFLLNQGLLSWLLLLHFVIVFPRPKPLIARFRVLFPALLYGGPAAWLAGSAAWSVWAGQPLRFFQLAAAPELPLIIGGGVAALWSLAQSYRAARDSVERAQVAWVGLGFGAVIGWYILLGGAFLLAATVGDGGLGIAGETLIGGVYSLGAAALLAPPVCLAVAVLRHRLFEIDVALNRTLVYGGLTLGIAAAYGLALGALAVLFQGAGSLPLTLLAAGAAAVLFNPLRERLQRAVNRLLYGERDDPYAAMADLSRRLEAAIAPDAVLPAIVETVAGRLKLPSVAIQIRQGEELIDGAVFDEGGAGQGQLVLPIVYQGEEVGRLVARSRWGEQELGRADRRLLEALARQAGAVVHGARLTADLRRSRERLVAAREEERRRLRRDLHDGLGPTLAGLTLKVDAARNLLGDDPATAERLLAELRGQIQSAVGDIRRLVYALRPPALDQLGLAGALEELAEQCGQEGPLVELDLPAELPPLPPAVEVAAYRIAQEALTNVVRHSGARRCALRLQPRDDGLELLVEDEGRGMASDGRPGVGLASMAERAAELGGVCSVGPRQGGGTLVRAWLPLR